MSQESAFEIDAQAREEGNALVRRFREDPILSALNTKRLTLTSLAEVDAALANARSVLSDAAQRIAPRYALPTLIHAVGACYYGSDRVKAHMIGPALKIAVASVWPFVWRNAGASALSSDLDRVVSAARVVEQLQFLQTAFSVVSDGHVVMDADGYVAEGAIDGLLNAMNFASARRGENLRLAQDTAMTILAKAPTVLRGIVRVLHGEAPADVDELRHCWLSRLSKNERRAFWERLYSHLHVLFLMLLPDPEVSGDRWADPLLFSDFSAYLDLGLGGEIIELYAKDLFWRQDWYLKQSLDWHQNLVVERPLLRIARDPALYCSSRALAGDAINSFVEASIIPYPNSSGVPLSQAAFRSLLSEPFERQVEREMRKLGFRAGTVTEKGVWRLDRSINLTEKAGELPPGEIDVLAIHDNGWLFVLECKVLAMPTTKERLRNLLGKLGEDDTEAVRAKVLSKLQWVRRIAGDLVGPSVSDAAIVVLDRPWPAMSIGPDVSVVELSILRQAVQSAMTA